jgi:hypothetical protein
MVARWTHTTSVVSDTGPMIASLGVELDVRALRHEESLLNTSSRCAQVLRPHPEGDPPWIIYVEQF